MPAALLAILNLHLFPPAEAAVGRGAKTAWLSGVEPGTPVHRLSIESKALLIEAPVKAPTQNRIRIQAPPAPQPWPFSMPRHHAEQGLRCAWSGGQEGKAVPGAHIGPIGLGSESSARPDLRRSFLPTRKVRGSTWRNPALAEPRERTSVRCSPTASPAMPSLGCGRGAKTWLQIKDDVALFHPVLQWMTNGALRRPPRADEARQ